jgi:hypothetical protein
LDGTPSNALLPRLNVVSIGKTPDGRRSLSEIGGGFQLS